MMADASSLGLDAAKAELAAALEVVRGAYDDGADDWQFRLLNTFAQYCRSIGVEPRLVDPIFALRMDEEDRVLRRRLKAGPGAPAARMRKTATLTMAAAAVTIIHERELFSVEDAYREISRHTGVQAQEVRKFRNRLNSGTAPKGAWPAYNAMLAELREWPHLDTLSRLGSFLKNPPIT